MTASVVCFAPHLIDYTAYAIAQRPDGSVVIAGSARDRWHGTPYKYYGVRAVVQVTGGSSSTNGCGSWSASASTREPIGSSGVVVDGLAHDGTCSNGSLAGRQYQGVAVRRDGSFVTAALNGAISSFTAAGAVDTGFGTGGTTTIGTSVLHAVRLCPTAASSPPARAPAPPARSACSSPSSARRALPRRFGTAGVVRLLAGTGNNQGQALALQSDGRILIAGGAVHSGNVSSFAVARLTAAGAARHGVDAHGRRHDDARRDRLRHGDLAVGERLRRRRPPRRRVLGNAYMDVVVARYVGGP